MPPRHQLMLILHWLGVRRSYLPRPLHCYTECHKPRIDGLLELVFPWAVMTLSASSNAPDASKRIVEAPGH